MGVGSVSLNNNMSNLQAAMTTGSVDVKSKNIQNEIDDTKQQMQKLTSKEELSVDEKADERKKLQREISNLNTELERHKEEFLREQKRELMLDELRGDKKPEEEKAAGVIQADENDKKDGVQNDSAVAVSDTDAISSDRKLPADVSSDSSVQNTAYQGTVIFQNSDGVVILKGIMGSDENGIDAEQQQAGRTDEEEDAVKETKPIDDDEEKDTGLSHKEVNAMVSSNVSMQQANRQETVISEMNGKIDVLEGEINQDKRRGDDTDRKQAELRNLEEREKRAEIFRFSVLEEADNMVRTSADTGISSVQNDNGNAVVNAARMMQGEQDLQQFYVSVG